MFFFVPFEFLLPFHLHGSPFILPPVFLPTISSFDFLFAILMISRFRSRYSPSGTRPPKFPIRGRGSFWTPRHRPRPLPHPRNRRRRSPQTHRAPRSEDIALRIPILSIAVFPHTCSRPHARACIHRTPHTYPPGSCLSPQTQVGQLPLVFGVWGKVRGRLLFKVGPHSPRGGGSVGPGEGGGVVPPASLGPELLGSFF